MLRPMMSRRMSSTTWMMPPKRPILVPLAFPLFGNRFDRNRVDQRLVAVNIRPFERLKSTPRVPVANGSMHVFKTESARTEHWRLSVEPEFLPATWALSGVII